MISIICNDRLGGKVRIKCFKRDSILTVKKLIGAHTGTRFQKIRLQKAHVIFKDHVSVDDYRRWQQLLIPHPLYCHYTCPYLHFLTFVHSNYSFDLMPLFDKYTYKAMLLTHSFQKLIHCLPYQLNLP